jgi:hypothetical protein
MQANYLLIQVRENCDLHFIDILKKIGNVSSLWPSMTIKVSILLFLIFILLSEIEAIGADWKYLGGATLPKGQQAIVFYDSESIKYTKDKTIKVWTKSYQLFDFISVKNRNEHKVLEKSAAKQRSQYYPPYTLVNPKTGFDDFVEIISWEEVANSFRIKARAKVLFEIKCADNMIRTLSIVSYKYIGDIESRRNSTKTGAWNHISSKSNADTLQKILCK